MKIFSLTLVANVSQDLPSGSYLHFMTGDDTKPVDFQFFKDSQPVLPATGAKPGYSADFRGLLKIGETKYFSRVSVVSAFSQVIEVGVADAVGGYNRFSGTVVVTGTVAANATDVLGNTLTNPSPVALSTTEAVLAAADSSRTEIIFYNESATITALLIPAGGSAANGIPLPPLTTYTNTRSARAAWSGITASGTTTVRVMKGTIV